MSIIGMRKVSYTISSILVLSSIAALLIWGLKFGIDFTGGSLLEVEFSGARPDQATIISTLGQVDIHGATVQPTGDRGAIIRLPDLQESQHQAVLQVLRTKGDFVEKRFDSIGPTIGAELRSKSLTALVIVLLMIVLYISWAFRQVSRPMSSWKYGVAAVIALFHDVFIPLGVFAFLGHYYGVEVDTLFVTALLTVLGFSIQDTIVVFDRIRENLRKYGKEDFEQIVDRSIHQTIGRSINTSLTVLVVMMILFLYGGVATKYFSLTLLLGVFFGTYSSIFIASAILVSWYRYSLKKA